MPFFKAATGGTLLTLAGSVLLLLVTLSAPIIKSLYFLSAKVTGSGTGAAAGISASGTIHLGTFGFCVDEDCINARFGYDLSEPQRAAPGQNLTFRVAGDNSLLDALSDYLNLPNSLIHWLTYVLIVHPIAAGFGFLALLFGLLAHRREFTFRMTLVSTWFGGIAAFLALLAFVFDMVVFTIAKNRIKDAASNSDTVTVRTDVSYGTAIWLTLAAFICFTLSGCAFGAGRRMARARQQDKIASEAFRPHLDDAFATDARNEARFAYDRRRASSSSLKDGDLPYFAEPEHETVPLRAYSDNRDQADFGSRPEGPLPHGTASSAGYEVDGVGLGYGRRAPHRYQDSLGGNDQVGDNSGFHYNQTGASAPQAFQSMYPSATPVEQVPPASLRPDALQAGRTPSRVSALPMGSFPTPTPGLHQSQHQDSYHDPYQGESAYTGVEAQHAYSHDQAYDPPLPVASSAGFYAAAPPSQAPTYQTYPSHSAPPTQSGFNYFSPESTYESPPQPQYEANTFYQATNDYAHASDAQRTEARSPAGPRYAQGD